MKKTFLSRSDHFRKTRRSSFTLTELLVVVAIIIVLIALLMPSLKRAKYQARHIQCKSNMRQLGAITMVYATDNDTEYPATTAPSVLGLGEIRTCRMSSYGFETQWYNGPLTKAYLSYATYFSKNTIGLANPLWRCPEGEIQNKTVRGANPAGAYYGRWFDLQGGSGFKYEYTFPSPHILKNPEWVMKRMGERYTIGGLEYGSGMPANPKYSILFGDLIYRCPNAPYGMGTNHAWGGNRVGPASPVQGWNTLTGIGDANYVFDDGSVKSFNGFRYQNVDSVKPMFYQTNQCGQGGDACELPASFATY